MIYYIHGVVLMLMLHHIPTMMKLFIVSVICLCDHSQLIHVNLPL